MDKRAPNHLRITLREVRGGGGAWRSQAARLATGCSGPSCANPRRDVLGGHPVVLGDVLGQCAVVAVDFDAVSRFFSTDDNARGQNRDVIVLGAAVFDGLLQRWRGWYAPSRQPFRLDGLAPGVRAQIPLQTATPTDEWRDTFFMYGGEWTWLTEGEVASLAPLVRRSLMAARRRAVAPKPQPLWPSQLARMGDGPLVRWVEHGVRPSQHGRVRAETWERAEAVLPNVRRLAGGFASSGSGPNCFSTVVAAADDLQVAQAWMQDEAFDSWLQRRTDPVSGTTYDGEPGTVMVWTENGVTAHTAITIGGSWALSKPSQSWSSPRLVWTVRDTVHAWRLRGTKLTRHRLA